MATWSDAFDIPPASADHASNVPSWRSYSNTIFYKIITVIALLFLNLYKTVMTVIFPGGDFFEFI